MTFRYARHTTDLKRIEKFYTTIIGLKKLGGFQDHDHYDGIFLGLKDQSWHLEFTVSDDYPESKFDEDDALVFYVNTEIELTAIRKRITDNAIFIETPKNPYWQKFGLQISNPAGYKIIFAITHQV